MKHDDPNAKLKSEYIRARELADMAAVLQTKEGRRFVWRLLDAAGVFRTVMTGNSWTFFNDGMRSLGLSVYTDLMDACPDRLKEMWNEAKAQKQEDENYGKRD